MNKIFLFLFLSALLFSKTITIASYNVDNLFDANIDGGEYAIYDGATCVWNKILVEQKLKNTTEIICDIDADVIALQEVENENILIMLQKHLSAVGCKYKYRAITKRPNTTIHNALLSRIPIDKHPDILIDGEKKYRSILHVSIGEENRLHIFANHWKAKNRNGVESKRILYAKALNRAIADLRINSDYLLLGDFNSDYDEYLHLDKRLDDSRGKTGINNILHTIDKNDLVTLEKLKNGLHSNLWLDLPKSQRWSRKFYSKRDSMDAILIPKKLYDFNGWEYVHNSFDVLRNRHLLNKYGTPKRWYNGGCKFDKNGYSDHLPVYAKFEYRKSGKNRKSGWLYKVKNFFSFTVNNESDKSDSMKPTVNHKLIEVAQIKDLNKSKVPLLLKSLQVVLKSNDSAIVEDTGFGSLLLYKCARGMKPGLSYDIVAKTTKEYRGRIELIDISYTKVSGNGLKIRKFSKEIFSADNLGEVVSNISGIYKDGKLMTSEMDVKIYFKKWVKRPKNGNKIEIQKAEIGKYKDKLELIVWDENDYDISR